MSSQYDAIAARALATIAAKGAPVTFPGPGRVYDAATDTWSGTPGADVVGRAVQIDGDPDQLAALGLVLSNPVTLLVAASGLGITPTPGKLMTWAGTTYTIRAVNPTAPDGTAIVYTVVGSV